MGQYMYYQAERKAHNVGASAGTGVPLFSFLISFRPQVTSLYLLYFGLNDKERKGTPVRDLVVYSFIPATLYNNQ